MYLCNIGESIAASGGEFKGKGGSYAANKTGKKGRLYFLTIRVFRAGQKEVTRSAARGLVVAVKKDREPSEAGPEGSLALSRCAGTEERSSGVRRSYIAAFFC
jgi:hypothetical protein